MEVRINLGCRGDVKPDWDNYDFYYSELGKGIRRLDIGNEPLPYEDNSVDEVMADSVIEHLRENEAAFALHEAYRVLKPGGQFTIIVPDLDFIIRIYAEGYKIQAHTQLYGTNDEGQWHRCGFWADKLEAWLTEMGFNRFERFKYMDDLAYKCTK